MTARLRFAPSPNGRLHLGHAFSALTNRAMADRLGGEVLLRIENIDRARCRPELEAAIEEDLRWIGFAWTPPTIRQTDDLARHAEAARSLRARRLIYPCFCSRADIGRAIGRATAETGGAWPQDPDGAPLYPGLCRRLPAREAERRVAAGEPHAWRLDGEAARASVDRDLVRTALDAELRPAIRPVEPARWGDAVIVRKDIPTSYVLAVVVDDAAQSITHVVRGLDLEPATDLQVLLQRLLGLPSPVYHHHALVLDGAGHKLSKSRGSVSLADLRATGAMANAVRASIGF